MLKMYNKIKKRNGEAFAQEMRNFHNGLFEIKDIDLIVRHAGREAAPILPYLMNLLTAQNKAKDAADESAHAPEDPFALLEEAGYDAFYADTLDKQNSIKKYFAKGELLCTFNDAARHKDYHIVHAIKKNVAEINRQDFRGKEERQDEYGTSVISIQMLKTGGFISIKNRYNHTVLGCDNTFNSNPDNIISGLSEALRTHFNVKFKADKNPLPEGFVVQGDRIFRYHWENNNFYFGDQSWACNGVIHDVDRAAGNTLFEHLVFDNKGKVLTPIDPLDNDSFADDFNNLYGGNSGLAVQNGNLVLDGKILIRAEKSRITAISLPALTTIGHACLSNAHALTQLNAPFLTTMGDACLSNAHALTQFNAPLLTTMGAYCFHSAFVLTQFDAPSLKIMGQASLCNTPALTKFNAPSLIYLDDYCLQGAHALRQFNAPLLREMGNGCLQKSRLLTQFNAPLLTTKKPALLSPRVR